MSEAAQNSAVYSGAIIARLLCITPRRLQQLAKEGVVPKLARDQYPLAGSVRAYIQYLQNGTGVDNVDPEKLRPFERKAHYAAELDRLKLERERGELIPRIEVEQEMAALLKMISELFDTMPDVLERDCGLEAKTLNAVEGRLDNLREDIYKRMSEGEDAGADVRERA